MVDNDACGVYRMLQEEKQTADQRVEEIETRFGGQRDDNLGRTSPPVRSGRSTPGVRQQAFHVPHADVSNLCHCNVYCNHTYLFA